MKYISQRFINLFIFIIAPISNFVLGLQMVIRDTTFQACLR